MADIVKEKKACDKVLLQKLDQLEEAKKTQMEKTAYGFGFMDGWKAAMEYLQQTRESDETN